MSDISQFRLGDHISILSGYPFASDQFSNDDGVPLIRIRDITDNTTPDVCFSGDFDSSYMIKGSDVLIGMDGDFNIVRWKGGEGLLNQRVLKITENPSSELDLEFLFFWLQDYLKKVNDLTAATTVKHLSVKDVADAMVPAPQKAGQKRIASILSTSVAQITQTQSLIDKYTAIKQGMMADLFSRGIDTTTGQLRPTFEEAPELYKKTELGWVPKAWGVCLLRDKINEHSFVQTGPFGSQLHSYEYVEAGIPVMMPQNLMDGQVCLDKIAKITDNKAASLSRHLVKDNDVIFSRRWDLTRSAYISNERNNVGFSCGTGCLLLRVSAQVIHGGWFSLLYGTPVIQNQVDGLAVGSTMANLNSKILGKLLAPFPSTTEQRLIYNRVGQAEHSLSLLRNEQSKRMLQKKGLMQDLLTGKVPVPA